MVAKIGIKPVVSEQLPSFVAEDNPVFIAFMEAYFEYVEQQNQLPALAEDGGFWMGVCCHRS